MDLVLLGDLCERLVFSRGETRISPGAQRHPVSQSSDENVLCVIPDDDGAGMWRTRCAACGRPNSGRLCVGTEDPMGSGQGGNRASTPPSPEP